MSVDPELIRLYKLILKEGFRVVEVFKWHNTDNYSIYLEHPDYPIRDEYEDFDCVILIPRNR